jgi:hypothetical protein
VAAVEVLNQRIVAKDKYTTELEAKLDKRKRSNGKPDLV